MGKNMKKTVVGVIVMAVAIVGIIGWELFGRENVLFTEVLVLNKDTEPYTVITEENLAIKKVYQPNANSYTINDISKVVGKETTQFVPVGIELQARFFENPTLQVNETNDEYVYSISVNTLEAYPRSIAKGDTVYIFCMDEEVIRTTVLGLRNSDGNEVIQKKDRKEATGQIASIEIKATKEQCRILSVLQSNSQPLAITYN